MPKPKQEVSTITRSASLAGKALARLEAAAAEVHESETARRARGFQAVSTKEGFHAVIRHEKTLIEISGSEFAISQTD